MVAMPLVVALRPVSSDARVGEHRAVVWKFENVTPRSAMRAMFGHCTGPPKVSIVAKPRSSHASSSTLGDPGLALGARKGVQSGSESRMSMSILPLNPAGMGVLLFRG